MHILEIISEFISFLINKFCKNLTIFILFVAKFLLSKRKDKNSGILFSKDLDIIDILLFSNSFISLIIASWCSFVRELLVSSLVIFSDIFVKEKN